MDERQKRLELVVGLAESGSTLGTFLRRKGISLTVVRGQKHVENGLLVNGLPAKTNHKLRANDRVELVFPLEKGFSAQPQLLPLKVLYASAEALVLDKPAGMPTHPGPGVRTGTLANAVCGLYSRHSAGGTFHPVGRLDTNTSGLALCACNVASANKLAATAQKVYIALVGGRVQREEMLIDRPLAASPGSAVRQQAAGDGKPSRTHMVLLAAGAKASLVLARPYTGRTHQIRAHMAHVGHPLLGDGLYGGDTGLLKRHGLHCAALVFEELGGNNPLLYQPMPRDMRGVVGMLWPERAGTLLDAAWHRARQLLAGRGARGAG